MIGKIRKTLLTISIAIFAANSYADKILETTFTHDLAFSKALHVDGEFVENNLVIAPFTLKHDISKTPEKALQPEYGEPIWTITPKQLPVSEDTCLWADASLCKEHNNDYKDGMCVHSCISGGADLLAFDKNSNKLYLSARSTALGTGGGPFFLFAADIKKKEIKFLKIEYGPFDGNLSPDGKFLLMYGGSSIAIYNTLTTEEFIISEENNWDWKNMRLYFAGDIHWLTNTQFSYQLGIRHSKFQGSFDEMKENVYDIPSKKIIRTRIMAKTEFDSTPYTEPN